MEFATLEVFCAVATQQSVSRAASLMSCVQSKVSARIRGLEEEMQAQLFSRDGKHMTLTPSGQRLFEYAQRLLALADEAREAMHPSQPAGPLRIGTIESAAGARLPALLAIYHSRWPQVNLEICIGTSKSLADDVAAGRVDCAFIAEPDARLFALGGEAAARGLDGMHAYTEEMLLVMPLSHPPVKRPQDLRLSTLAVFTHGCTYRGMLERWLASAGPAASVAGRNWNVIELDSYHAILACVAAGRGFALCPKSILVRHYPAVEVRTREIASVETWLISRTGYSSSAYAALRRAVLARRHFASGKGGSQAARADVADWFGSAG
jgi:DNA-binding transcriptional LysR family regulator